MQDSGDGPTPRSKGIACGDAAGRSIRLAGRPSTYSHAGGRLWDLQSFVSHYLCVEPPARRLISVEHLCRRYRSQCLRSVRSRAMIPEADLPQGNINRARTDVGPHIPTGLALHERVCRDMDTCWDVSVGTSMACGTPQVRIMIESPNWLGSEGPKGSRAWICQRRWTSETPT